MQMTQKVQTEMFHPAYCGTISVFFCIFYISYGFQGLFAFFVFLFSCIEYLTVSATLFLKI